MPGPMGTALRNMLPQKKDPLLDVPDIGTDNARNFFSPSRVAMDPAVSQGMFGTQPYESGPVGKAHWGGGIPRPDTNFDPFAEAAARGQGWAATPDGIKKIYDQYRSTGDPAARRLLESVRFQFPSDPGYLDRAGR